MYDEHTIRICEEFAPLIQEPDAIEAEYIELRRSAIQCRYLRRVCIKMELSTALDIAMPYKGRTYFSLASHPVVRRKKKRMRELRALLKARGALEMMERRSDPRTSHWFRRVA